jgi:hypothetical protein
MICSPSLSDVNIKKRGGIEKHSFVLARGACIIREAGGEMGNI